MTITELDSNQHPTLARLGLSLNNRGHAVLTDYYAAGVFNRHHTFMPVAAAAWTLSSPAFAKEQLRDYKLSDLVRTLRSLSGDTTELLAKALCLDIQGPYRWQDNRCFEHLLYLIKKYELGPFVRQYRYEGPGHFSIRPWGISGDAASQEMEVKRFRSAFRQRPLACRMLVATIIWLYRSPCSDDPWLTRIKRDWSAFDAIQTLKAEDMLEDWGKFVVLCPGW